MIEVALASQLATMRRIYEKRGHLAKAMNYDKSPSQGQLELLERDLNAIIGTLTREANREAEKAHWVRP